MSDLTEKQRLDMVMRDATIVKGIIDSIDRYFLFLPASPPHYGLLRSDSKIRERDKEQYRTSLELHLHEIETGIRVAGKYPNIEFAQEHLSALRSRHKMLRKILNYLDSSEPSGEGLGSLIHEYGRTTPVAV